MKKLIGTYIGNDPRLEPLKTYEITIQGSCVTVHKDKSEILEDYSNLDIFFNHWMDVGQLKTLGRGFVVPTEDLHNQIEFLTTELIGLKVKNKKLEDEAETAYWNEIEQDELDNMGKEFDDECIIGS